MKIRLGYACITNALDITSSSTLTYKYYKKLGEEYGNEKLDKIIKSNFEALKEILNYNIKNQIYFYRMTSNLIPLATHPNVSYEVFKKYEKEFIEIGNIIKNNNLRVDMHPDQYCVLNSINESTINSTINILEFCQNMFNAMQINSNLVLHIGSKTNGKKESMKRFIDNFNLLNKELKEMIILENDDKTYNIRNTLKIANTLNIPMVLDYHHYKCNNNNEKIENYIEKIFSTWKTTPKIHFSSPKNKKEKRSHNEYIDSDEFIKFIEKIKFVNKDFDIMIEAKGKDDAMFRLIRQLKYKTNYKFINETTFLVK
ncbi:MAG: UV DNA damage repair endonuclease UvsE [Bacilli bacterium]|nr:UV DNA damage repair endonuclease UvsE [Bacilli bacterium]